MNNVYLLLFAWVQDLRFHTWWWPLHTQKKKTMIITLQIQNGGTDHYWAAKSNTPVPGHHQGTPPKSPVPPSAFKNFVTRQPARKGFDGSARISYAREGLSSGQRCERKCTVEWTESILKSFKCPGKQKKGASYLGQLLSKNHLESSIQCVFTDNLSISGS
jgi:hypothetical protein